MPTSTAAPSIDQARSARRSRLSTSAGFTLIEIGLVLLIIGIVIALVVPRFTDQSRAALVAQTRKLAAVVRFLQDEAVLNGRVYQLNFDLDRQRYFVTSAEEGESLGGGFQHESGILARDTVLPANVQIADVNVPMVGGKLSEGVAFAHFYPDGTIDQLVVHLDNGQEAFTLYIPDGFTGHAYVASGYLDVAAHG